MIDEAFYTALSGLIGSQRAYPVLASKNAVAPFVVYQRVSTIRDRTVAGDSGRNEATYRVDIYNTDPTEAEALAETISNGLSSYSDGTIRYIYVENEHDASDLSGDPSLYRLIMEIRVTYSV